MTRLLFIVLFAGFFAASSFGQGYYKDPLTEIDPSFSTPASESRNSNEISLPKREIPGTNRETGQDSDANPDAQLVYESENAPSAGSAMDTTGMFIQPNGTQGDVRDGMDAVENNGIRLDHSIDTLDFLPNLHRDSTKTEENSTSNY